MKFDERVFKANDIRGHYPDSIDESFGWFLGRGAVEVVGARKVLLGRDCRLSSPALSGAVHAGLSSAGAEVGVVGLCPSELIYYLMGSGDEYDLAVIVTASHNPPEYNGFKVVGPGGEPVTSAGGLGEIRDWMHERPEPKPPAALDAGPAAVSEPQQTVFAEKDYIRFVVDEMGEIPDPGALKIVVDPGNGTGGILWEDLSAATGLEPIRMNFEPDGRFPAHMPNPAKSRNIEPLRRRVVDEGADIGFAYDGDADRTVAVLDDGGVVDGSQMIVALAEALFEDDPSALCAVSMTTSRKVLDFLRQNTTEPVVVPVGHAKVKRIMRKRPEIDFAGEESGHYFFREFFSCESSLMTTLHLLHLSAEGRLRPLLKSLPGPWVRPDPEPAYPFEHREKALAACTRAAKGALEIFPEPDEIMCEYEWEIGRHCTAEDIDEATGVRMDYADWWFAVRPSGTEPLARLAGEARTEELLTRRLEALGEFFE